MVVRAIFHLPAFKSRQQGCWSRYCWWQEIVSGRCNHQTQSWSHSSKGPITLVAGNNIRKMQLPDPLLGPFFQWKEAGEKPSPAKLGSPSSSSCRLLQLWEKLVTSKGILCHRFESLDGSSSTLQVVVPVELWKEVLAELHQGVG